MKVAVNRCYGGFSLSYNAYVRLRELIPELEDPGKKEKSGWDCHYLPYEFSRSNPLLIQVIEELGEKESGGTFAEIKIVEIPDDVDFIIWGCGGKEWITERTW